MSKKIKIAIILFSALLFSSPPLFSASKKLNLAKLFPLSIAAKWTYQANDGSKTSTEIIDKVTNEQYTYYLARADSGRETLYLPLKDALLRIEKNTIDQQKTVVWVLLRSPLAKDNVWPSHFPADKDDRGQAYFRFSQIENVQNANNSWADCYKISFYTAGSPITSAVSWYAPEVGPVKISEHSFQLNLVDYQPGKEKTFVNQKSFADWSKTATADDLLKNVLKGSTVDKQGQPLKQLPNRSQRVSSLPTIIIYSIPIICLLAVLVCLLLLKKYLISETESLGLSSKANLHLALAKIRAGEISEALDTLETKFPDEKEYPDVLYALGLALESSGKTEQALSKFQRALELNPHYQKPLIAKARCLKELGKFAEAEVDFRRVLEQNPHFPDVHNAIGELLIIKGQSKEAIWHFKEALRLNPQLIKAQENLEKLNCQL